MSISNLLISGLGQVGHATEKMMGKISEKCPSLLGASILGCAHQVFQYSQELATRRASPEAKANFSSLLIVSGGMSLLGLELSSWCCFGRSALWPLAKGGSFLLKKGGVLAKNSFCTVGGYTLEKIPLLYQRGRNLIKREASLPLPGALVLPNRSISQKTISICKKTGSFALQAAKISKNIAFKIGKWGRYIASKVGWNGLYRISKGTFNGALSIGKMSVKLGKWGGRLSFKVLAKLGEATHKAVFIATEEGPAFVGACSLALGFFIGRTLIQLGQERLF